MMQLWVLLTCTVLFELAVLRRLRFDWFTVALVLSSTLLCTHYLGYTSVDERNYDVSSHIEYIQWILEQHQIPDVSKCMACSHPPLYYLLAALWSRLTTLGGWLPLELGLKWLSLLLFFGFVVFALLIFRSLNARPKTLHLATALVVFWPSSIINSVRVHNDALASLLMLASVYFIARWDRKGRASDFYLALSSVVLALLTKSSGYAVAATLLGFAVLGLRPKETRRSGIKTFGIAVLVIASTAVLSVALRVSPDTTTLCGKLLGHACDGRYVLPVPDTLQHFVYFDLPDFVLRIDTMPKYPEPDYFLNRLAKSSLFGVMPLGEELGSERHKLLASVISLLLLAMTILGAASLFLVRKADITKYRVYLAASFLLFVFLLAFRIRVPNEYHEDFRHIFPVLVPSCLAYALLVERLGRVSRLLYSIGLGMALLMVASSVAFFTQPH